MSDGEEIPEKVLKYEKFVNEVLKEDLKKILDDRDKVYEQISEYLQLRNVIEKIKTNHPPGEPLKTQVDIGCNNYVQGVISNPSRITVYVGFGIYVEYKFEEALKFIEKRIEFLTDITNIQTRDSNQIKAHIGLVLEGLRECQMLSDETSVM